MSRLRHQDIRKLKCVDFKPKFFLILIFLLAGLAVMGKSALWNSVLSEDEIVWTDHLGQPLRLKDYAKKPIVLTMAYSRCKKTCPLITMKELKEIQKIFDDEKKEVDFFIITLDPANDTTEVLSAFKKKVGVSRDSWHFLRSSEQATRALAISIGLGDYWSMDDHIHTQFGLAK